MTTLTPAIIKISVGESELDTINTKRYKDKPVTFDEDNFIDACDETRPAVIWTT
jgi:hypothetical protein